MAHPFKVLVVDDEPDIVRYLELVPPPARPRAARRRRRRRGRPEGAHLKNIAETIEVHRIISPPSKSALR
jgi:hypothetical protein